MRAARPSCDFIANDIEGNLASYVAVVTAINRPSGAGRLGAVAFGFSNPIIFGVAAMFLNYIPMACMAIMLLAVGLVTFPTLGYALLPPAASSRSPPLKATSSRPRSGQRLTNPLAVSSRSRSGPQGRWGVLAVLLIVALVIFDHLFPSDDIKLPG